ncbi:MAG: TonB-dependent receptor [Vitreimonas sp.]
MRFDIAAQPLASALSDFARQSGLQVLYPFEPLQRVQSLGLHGDYTRADALTALLSNSGYRAAITGDTVRLEATGPQRQADAASEQTETPNADASDTDETIVVTGTRIRGAHPAGANLTTLDAQDMRETGRSTVQDVLQTLPQNFMGGQNEVTQLQTNTGGQNSTFGSSINLRGLGSDATLTLVNGRRLAPGGLGNFVDISNIPLAAVDRVEILADGASATYGSDAVAGVVNIILSSHFDGQETTLRYGGVTDGRMRETIFSHVMGASNARGSIVAGYEYRDRDSLGMDERTLSASSDLRPFGGDNFSRNTSNPGNITRIGTTPVTIAIPHGQDGSHLTQADLLVGQVNLQNLDVDGDLFPSQHSNDAFVSAHYDLAPNFTVFADVFGGVRDARSRDTQLSATISVPESNAWRQLDHLFTGQGPLTIAYNFAADLGPTRYKTRAVSVLGDAGFRWTPFGDWQIEGAASLGRQIEDQHFTNALNTSALTTALASSILNTAFNPFADGSNTDPAVLQSIIFRQDSHANAEMNTLSLKADGPLFDLPAGTVRAALGVERRDESFTIDLSKTVLGVTSPLPIQPPGSRTTDAVFGELYVPLVDASMHLPLVNTLDLSLSVRREQSDDYGSAQTPKIGVQWGVTNDFSVRYTWGESFKAPQFQQILGDVTGTQGAAPPSIDPNATNGSTGLFQLGGPNPDLKPERATNWTAGFDFIPSWLSGFEFHATYFDIDFRDRIARPGLVTAAFRNPAAYAGFLILNPTPAQIAQYRSLATRVSGTVPPDGIEAIYDGRLTNLSSQQIRGIDLSASYRLRTSIGELGVTANASDLLEFSSQPLSTLPSIDLLNTFNNPVDWKGRLGFLWRDRDWAALLSANYTNSYRDNVSIPTRRIASWTTYDLQISHHFGDEHGADIALNVLNLTDEQPPFVNNAIGIGFDPANASLLGRFVSLELRKRW